MKEVLALWDIDGTLVNVYKHHTPAYQAAMKRVFGVEPSFDEIEVNYGKPASEVVWIPLLSHGVIESEIKSNLRRVFEIYALGLEEGIKSSLENVVLPGVSEVLKSIDEHDVPMGIVTGNIRRAGESIVRGVELDHFFDPSISAYADGVSKRSEIVASAIRQALELSVIGEDTKVYVFGDTPSDVIAAKANDCVSIAVIKNSNQPSSSPGGNVYMERKELLIKAQPDFLLDNFTDLSRVMEILGL